MSSENQNKTLNFINLADKGTYIQQSFDGQIHRFDLLYQLPKKDVLKIIEKGMAGRQYFIRELQTSDINKNEGCYFEYFDHPEKRWLVPKESTTKITRKTTKEKIITYLKKRTYKNLGKDPGGEFIRRSLISNPDLKGLLLVKKQNINQTIIEIAVATNSVIKNYQRFLPKELQKANKIKKYSSQVLLNFNKKIKEAISQEELKSIQQQAEYIQLRIKTKESVLFDFAEIARKKKYAVKKYDPQGKGIIIDISTREAKNPIRIETRKENKYIHTITIENFQEDHIDCLEMITKYLSENKAKVPRSIPYLNLFFHHKNAFIQQYIENKKSPILIRYK